jgi:hypothetical protein
MTSRRWEPVFDYPPERRVPVPLYWGVIRINARKKEST